MTSRKDKNTEQHGRRATHAMSIRRSLVFNFAGVVVLVSAILVAITAMRNAQVIQLLSERVIDVSLAQSTVALRDLFSSGEEAVTTARDWGRSGLLDTAAPETLNRLFMSALRGRAAVSSLLVADEAGNSFLLVREATGWRNRIVRIADARPGEARWLTWDDAGTQMTAEAWGPAGEDLRTVSWWPAAMASARKNDPAPNVQWEALHALDTVQDSGLTAWTAFLAEDGSACVAACDVRERDSTQVTGALRPTENAQVIITSEAGLVIGLPKALDDAGTDTASEPRHISDLDSPLFKRALLSVDADGTLKPSRLLHDGETWWVGVRALALDADTRCHVGILVPQRDLFAENTWRIETFLLLTGFGLALAVVVGVYHANRYSRPLAALVEQSRRISRLDLEPGERARSGLKELDELSRTMDQMRGTLARETADRRLATEALARSEERFRGIFEATSEAIITMDESGVIESVNPAAERMFGYAPGELAGAEVRRLMPPDAADQHQAHVRQYVASGEARVIGQGRIARFGLRKDGVVFPIAVTVNEVRLSGRRFFIGVISDMTDQRRAEEVLRDYSKTLEAEVAARTDELQRGNIILHEALHKLRRMQGRLITQEKLASLGGLTAGIAHEIKNPLNFVNNFAELSAELLDELEGSLLPFAGSLPESTRAEVLEHMSDLRFNVTKIAEHGKRADAIVQGMLAHSRGKSSEFHDTDLNALVDEYVKLAYHGVRAQEPTFKASFEKRYDPTVGMARVVPQNIARVVLNLINNACHATQQKQMQGEPAYKPVIAISTRAFGDAVEIRIRDNGIGMSRETASRIFEPFFTTKPAGQGTGLGLSICYNIVVQEHHGVMRVESEDGQWTEFILTLPRNISA